MYFKVGFKHRLAKQSVDCSFKTFNYLNKHKNADEHSLNLYVPGIEEAWEIFLL